VYNPVIIIGNKKRREEKNYLLLVHCCIREALPYELRALLVELKKLVDELR
jgi:hypothetical protein